LSFSVHSNGCDLEVHLAVDTDGVITEFRNEPDTSDLDYLLSMASEITLKGLQCISNRFELRLDQYYNDRYEQLRGLIQSKSGQHSG